MTATIPIDHEVEITYLPLTDLTPHPENVRRDVGDITGLSASVAETGILEPLIVLPASDDDTHTIVAGHRRHAAADAAGLDTVPCIIRDLTEPEVVKAMLAENVQRSDITPVDEAYAYQRLIDWDTSIDEIADTVGRSVRLIRSRLRLLAWPDEVLNLIEDGKVPLGEIEKLDKWASHPDAPGLLAVHHNTILDSWSPPDRLGRMVHGLVAADAEDALLAQLADANITVASPWPTPHPAWPTYARGRIELAAFDWESYEQVAHTTEPCHAVVLGNLPYRSDEYELTAETAEIPQTPVCTDPDRHIYDGPDPAPPMTIAPRPEQNGTPSEPEPIDEKAAAFAAEWDAADEHRRTWWRHTWLPSHTDPVDPTLLDLTRDDEIYLSSECLDFAFNLQEEELMDEDHHILDIITTRLADTPKPVSAAFQALLTVDLIWDYTHDGYGPYAEQRAQRSARLLRRMIAAGYEPHPIEEKWLTERDEDLL